MNTFRTIYFLAAFVMVAFLFGTCASAQPDPDPEKDSHMKKNSKSVQTIIQSASLQLSPYCGSVFVDRGSEGFTQYGLPDLSVRVTASSYERINSIFHSATGDAIGLLGTNGQITIQARGIEKSWNLPIPPSEIHTAAISASGELLAVLRKDTTDPQNCVLEIRRFSAIERVIASADFPLFDHLEALPNADFSLIGVDGGMTLSEDKASMVFAFEEENGTLKKVYNEKAEIADWIRPLVVEDLIFVVKSDGIHIQKEGKEMMIFPGTLGETLICSPSGKHLLAYRVEEWLDAQKAKFLFRLIDLKKMEVQEAKEFTFSTNGKQKFALNNELQLLVVDLSENDMPTVDEISWKK